MASIGRGDDEEEKKREEKREEESDGAEKKREDEREEESDGGEKKREEKRKREEDSDNGPKEKNKKRISEDKGSEDQEPTPGSSHNATTSGPYPDFNISRFILHKMLGRGSFGKVFLASVSGRQTFMAIKTIEKTEDDMDTIVREQQILAAARECPFICHLYAAHHSEQRAYFITEYLSGGSLEDLIKMSL